MTFMTVEQLQATVAEQAQEIERLKDVMGDFADQIDEQADRIAAKFAVKNAENERLRALVETAFDEGLGHSSDLDHPHDVYWLVSETRAALQPKEGEG